MAPHGARGSGVSAASCRLRTCHVVTKVEPPREGAQRGHEVVVVQNGEPDHEIRHTQSEQQDTACTKHMTNSLAFPKRYQP